MDIILTKRLLIFLYHIKDPWCVNFKMDLLNDVKGKEKERYIPINLKDKYWHVRRINYLINSPSDLFYPINIRSDCTGTFTEQSTQYIETPNLIDGWHRFFAHIHLGYETIICNYRGQAKLLKYLKSEINHVPFATIL